MISHTPKSLLIVGPLPPPPTGPHVAFHSFCDDAQRRFGADRVQIIDTSQKIIKKNVKRIASLGNLKQAWHIAWQFRRKLKNANHVLIFGSNGFMLSMAPILLFMAKRRKTPVALRPFGGSLDQYAENLNPILRRILIWTLRHADALSVQTRLLQQGLTAAIGERRIQVAPNYRSIPPNGRAPRRPNGSVESLKLIFLGIVGEDKGVFVLLESMRQLAEKGGNVQCDIFGPVSPASAERFDREINRTENATYKGFLRPSKVIPTLRNYDVLVLPTFYQGEGHPGVIIEAMMAGVPVISTNHRSIPELVEDGVNGLLAAPRDAGSLTAAIDCLVQDRELVAELGRGSWKSRGRFDARHVVPAIFRQMGVEVQDPSEPLHDLGAEEGVPSAR